MQENRVKITDSRIQICMSGKTVYLPKSFVGEVIANDDGAVTVTPCGIPVFTPAFEGEMPIGEEVFICHLDNDCNIVIDEKIRRIMSF